MKIVAFTLENLKYSHINHPEEDYFIFKEKENQKHDALPQLKRQKLKVSDRLETRRVS